MEGSPAGPRIVVGVDGSEQSVEALRLAAQLAPAFDASIEAIACWDAPHSVPFDGLEQAMEGVLALAIEQAFGAGEPAGLVASVVRGPAAEKMVDAAEGADLMIVGRRGRGGFHGLVLGSVSSACVAHAKCPVLVVRGAETD